MRTIMLGIVLALGASGTEVLLRAPAAQGGGETLPVAAYSQTTPVQVTFEQNHDLAAGDTIYCIGMRGNPKLRGRLKVQSVLSGLAVTLMDVNGNSIPGTSGSGIDVDPAHDGVQLGYCGKLARITLNEHPRGIWPLAGSPQRARMTDPDGTGPLLAPAATDDAPGWAYLRSRNDPIVTPNGCDGRTASLCPVENLNVKSQPDRIAFGYGVAMLAFGWKMDATRTAWRNAAIFYLNNFQQAWPPSRVCYGCFSGVAKQAEGDDNDYASFAIAGYGWAFSLLRDQLTAEERETFVRKVWNDGRANCQNMLSGFGGQLTGDGTVLTTRDAGDLEAGDLLQIRTSARQYETGTGDLLDITVEGTTATLRFADTIPMPRTTTVKISNSGVAGLDGWFIGTIQGQTLSFPTTAPAGVYDAPGIRVVAPGPPNDRLRLHWVKVVSVDRGSQPHVVTVNQPISTGAYNSPWARSVKGWQQNSCGLVWLNNHHESHDVFENVRTGKPAAAVPVGQDFLPVTADSWPEFADLEPPYKIRVGAGEIMLVTGKDEANKRLLVERGQDWSVPSTQTTGVLIAYTPDAGPMVTLSTAEQEMIMGNYTQNKVNSTIPSLLVVAMATADDSQEARWYLEHFWNLYYDFHFRIQKRLFAGPNYAGPANLGYAFGRWAEFTTQVTMGALNSFQPALDLRYPGQKNVLEWGYSLSRPGDKRTHVSWGDSGMDRYYEKDELATLWCSPYLYPDAPESQRALDFYYREWNWLDGTSPEEWIIYRLIYASSQSPRMDYREGPLARVFHEKEPGLNSIAGAFHSRTSWTDPLATLVWAPIVMGGDHNGPYLFPGAVILDKGKTDLISGASSTAVTGNDVRAQYAVQVLKTNGIAILSGQNSGLSSPQVRIQTPAPPGGSVVEMQSDSSLVSVPRYVTIPEGATTAVAPVRVYQSPNPVTARIVLRGANEIAAYQRANLMAGTVSPQPSAIASVTVSGPVTAGHFVEGTITLSAAAPLGGTEVALTADHPGIAVPATVRIRAGILTTPFFVSAAPGASGDFRITASNSNSVQSQAATIVEATPVPANVLHLGLPGNDAAQGGLRMDGHGRAIQRFRIEGDFAYVRSDNSNSYDKTSDVADVVEAHRDILHLKPASGQDYLFTYDRLLHSRPGHQDVLRVPYHRMSHVDGSNVQNPPAEYARSGSEVNFKSPQYGVKVNSRVLIPSDPSVLAEDDSMIHATRLVAYGGQEAENDFLVVHQPCPDLTCAPPTWRLLPSSAGQRAVQIDDPAGSWIVTFSKGTQAMVGSFQLSVEPFTGSAKFVITGLSSVKPFTRYSVIRDGVTLLSDLEVREDGTLRFDATFGTGGAFAITSTGAAPLEILTHGMAQGTAGSPYSASLNGQGGVPPYAWSVASGSLCSGLSLTGNQIAGTPSQAGTCMFSLRLTDSQMSFVERSYSLTIKAPSMALVVTTGSIPASGRGEPYAANLNALGGEPPYNWALQSGSLPPGLSLSPAGAITGAATSEGDFSFTVRVTDSKGTSAQKAFELRVSVSHLVLETTELPVGFAQTPYEVQLAASGGLAPYSWSIVSGSLPPGLDLQSNGMLQGTCTSGTEGTVTIRVQDWAGRSQERTFQMTFRSSPGLLTAAVTAAGRNRLALRYGRYGLAATTECRVELSETTGFSSPLESRLDGGGPSFRTVVFGETSPLSPGHLHHFRVTCGPESFVRTAKTAAPGVAAARLLWVELHPSNLAPGERPGVEFGSSRSLGQTLAMTCASSCRAAVPGLSGTMLYHRTVVWDSAGRAVRRGQIRTSVPE